MNKQQPKQQRVVMLNPPQQRAQPKTRRRRVQRNRNRIQRELTFAPTGMSRVMRMQEPKLQTSISNGRAITIIHHREFLTDINGSVAFDAKAFPVNPGMIATFPWLASIANNWDSYLFRRLEFSYETACSTVTPGSVMLAIDFDAADPAPTSKLALMTYENAVRSSSWQECCYDARVSNLHKFGIQRFTRQSALATNLDIKTYDVGNLFIATSGQADTSPIGELYVDYVVELYTPQINASLLAPASKVVSGGTVSSAAPFGTAPVVTGAPLDMTATSITFPEAGQYLVSIILSGTSPVCGLPVGTGVTVTNLLDINSVSNALRNVLFDATPGGSVTFSATGTTTSTVVRLGAYPAVLA